MSGNPLENPYQPPLTDDQAHQSDSQVFVRSVPAAHGKYWVSSAWSLFKQAPWAIVGCWILWMCISMGIGTLIPFLSTVFTPTLLAGFAYSMHRLEQTGNFDIADIFEGFRSNFKNLLVLGGIMIVAMIGIAVLVALFIAVLMSAMDSGHMTVVLGLGLACILTGLALLLFILFATYWAPCLVFFNNQHATVAIRNSIQGMTKNMSACLIYGLMLFLLNLAVLLSAGLAIFVVSPLIMISAYTSYKDLFHNYEN